MIEVISKYKRNDVAIYIVSKLIENDLEFSYKHNDNILENPKILKDGIEITPKELYEFINKRKGNSK
jgi:hypothetical protein